MGKVLIKIGTVVEVEDGFSNEPSGGLRVRAKLDIDKEKQKKNEWYNGVKRWVEGYQACRDDIPALQAEADDLYEQMGAIRPAVSRVTIRSAAPQSPAKAP